ncbi:MAG TPA: LapA family protein [Solirubrobacterales bacterium]|nr:LapA family protein [Solirubrobacterales bacterium]
MADRNKMTPPSCASKKTPEWKWWAFGIAVLLLLIVVLQNSQDVEFKILFLVDTAAPLFVLLLFAAAIGAIIGYTGPILRRHRHNTRKEYGKD